MSPKLYEILVKHLCCRWEIFATKDPPSMQDLFWPCRLMLIGRVCLLQQQPHFHLTSYTIFVRLWTLQCQASNLAVTSFKPCSAKLQTSQCQASTLQCQASNLAVPSFKPCSAKLRTLQCWGVQLLIFMVTYFRQHARSPAQARMDLLSCKTDMTIAKKGSCLKYLGS